MGTRTDLSSAGWLYLHPDCKEGLPQEWRGDHSTHRQLLVDFVHGGDLVVDTDHDTFEVLDKLEPLLKHIQIAFAGPTDADTYLLFSFENKFLGMVEVSTEDDWFCIELVSGDVWAHLLKGIGYSCKPNTSAAYDPKIHIRNDLLPFLESFTEAYDPY